MSGTTLACSAMMIEWIWRGSNGKGNQSQPVAKGGGEARKGGRTHLARGRQEVDHLLHGARAVHVERDGDEVGRDRLADGVALLVGRVLEELLAEVVAEGV